MAHNYDLTNQRYGLLVALELLPQRDKWGGCIWKCVCDCGEIKDIPARYLLRPDGTGSTSCGCRRRANCASLASKFPLNGYKHGYSSHPLYRIWAGIKRRCYNVKDKSYPYYGGKGIGLAPKWISSPERFISWGLANGWAKGLCIDRKDPKKDYSPTNCRFITRSENSSRTFSKS